MLRNVSKQNRTKRQQVTDTLMQGLTHCIGQWGTLAFFVLLHKAANAHIACVHTDTCCITREIKPWFCSYHLEAPGPERCPRLDLSLWIHSCKQNTGYFSWLTNFGSHPISLKGATEMRISMVLWREGMKALVKVCCQVPFIVGSKHFLKLDKSFGVPFSLHLQHM